MANRPPEGLLALPPLLDKFKAVVALKDSEAASAGSLASSRT